MITTCPFYNDCRLPVSVCNSKCQKRLEELKKEHKQSYVRFPNEEERDDN